MNNFFLLNEALNCASVPALENGIARLNDIILSKKKDTDVLMKHHTIWDHNNGFCTTNELFYDIVSKETQRLVPIVFGTLADHHTYFNDEATFDRDFPNCCNGFLGISFYHTGIQTTRQIADVNRFNDFKNACSISNAYETIIEYWNNRAILFPYLTFCDHIWDQINYLSIKDDRFKLLDDKLKKLNAFVKNWKTGTFNFRGLGLDCSPDTPTRIENTRDLRSFDCPGLGKRVFSLHIKWSFGRQFFRLYFFPDDKSRRVYIGYIGSKDEIGFA